MMMAMLSTIDNPWNPFDHFDEWYAWDLAHGYNSSSFLARLVPITHETTDQMTLATIEDAIDEIVSENVSGMFIKVTREVPG